MAREDQLKKIDELVEKITSSPIGTLISNPNWGSINFEASRRDLELLFGLCSHLKILPLHLVPDSVAEQFRSSLAQVGETVRLVREFNIESENPIGVRESLVQQIKGHTEHLLTTTQSWIPFLAYQKGDIQKNIEALNTAVKEANRLLDEGTTEIANKKIEIASIVTAAREASASAGVGVFTTDFEGHAANLEIEAAKWFKYTAQFAIAALIAAFLSIFLPIDKDATSAQIFQYISSKLLVLLVLMTATVWCGRIYKAILHQVTVTRHRANALKTFQAFIKATTDDSTRDAVLIETTRAIFSNSPSGYLDSTDGSSESNTKIFEIIKSASKAA